MLDYTKIKKNFMTVKLSDGQTLFLGMPKKKTFTKMLNLQNISEETETEAALDAITELCVEILNNNKAKKQITKEYVEEVLEMDIEDMTFLFNDYMKFAGGTKKDPN